jgi:alpha-L-fucosidase 2
VQGLRARGGFEVDIAWNDGALTSATIRSRLGRPVVVRNGPRRVAIDTEIGSVYHFNRDLSLDERSR